MSDKPRFYRCGDDFPDCEFARTGKEIRIEPGQEFTCPYKRPQCPNRATEVKRSILGVWWKIGAAAIAILFLVWMLWASSSGRRGSKLLGAKTLSIPVT